MLLGGKTFVSVTDLLSSILVITGSLDLVTSLGCLSVKLGDVKVFSISSLHLVKNLVGISKWSLVVDLVLTTLSPTALTKSE